MNFGGCPCAAGKDCDCGLYGCRGNCNQGRSPCDCWLANRETAEQVERDMLHYIGHRVVEWACAIGVITLVYLIAFRGF